MTLQKQIFEKHIKKKSYRLFWSSLFFGTGTEGLNKQVCHGKKYALKNFHEKKSLKHVCNKQMNH